MGYELYELALYFCVDGVVGLAPLLLLVAVVDVLAEEVEFLLDNFGLFVVIFAGHNQL